AAARAKGLATAEAAKARGLAEADAIKARAAALAENQEAVVAQQLAEKWPEIVRAGAEAFGNVDHMVLLNGADGMSEMFAKALTMGGTGLGLARQLLSAMGTAGAADGPGGNEAGSPGAAGPGGTPDSGEKPGSGALGAGTAPKGAPPRTERVPVRDEGVAGGGTPDR
ncbi:flotillin domain-containing protein, partial [Streptomyces sp. KLMMK]|uniref:flotillin domain-containing protein n=1 Tax=Streptomyces sp. KLMMK TaxID=3109353 RepID=UPI003009E98F